MSKSKTKINITPGKIVRLVAFIAFTAAGFLLNKYGVVDTFGWGYFFGIVAMAILLG
jgi:hypothetical protein